MRHVLSTNEMDGFEGPDCLFPRTEEEEHEWTTILAAAQISYLIRDDGFGRQIFVGQGRGAEARHEILETLQSNQGWPPKQAEIPEPAMGKGRVPWTPFVMVVILVGLYLWTGPYASDNKLLVAGAVQSTGFKAGEWWRVFTALGIHGDAGHLIGNLVFTGLLSLFVCRRLGDGLGALLILLSGALGNTIMATLATNHLSVGASTGTFGALGVIVGVATTYYIRREPLNTLWTKAWIPFGVAAALFGWTGVGEVLYDLFEMPQPDPDSTTDVGAHFFGLLAGMAIGAPFGWPDQVRFSPMVQGLCALAAALLFAFAWRMALGSAF